MGGPPLGISQAVVVEMSLGAAVIEGLPGAGGSASQGRTHVAVSMRCLILHWQLAGCHQSLSHVPSHSAAHGGAANFPQKAQSKGESKEETIVCFTDLVSEITCCHFLSSCLLEAGHQVKGKRTVPLS